MRALRSEEEKNVLAKIKFFVGDNACRIFDGGEELFLHKQRVFILSKKVKAGTSTIPRKNLVTAGTVLGRFTKNGKFRLEITSLNILSPWALYKVWIKSSAEMNYIYGNNSLKSHVFCISENIPINAGVFVFNQSDVPLGFGITSLTPQKYSIAEGHTQVIIRQSDTGEYIRNEALVA